MNINITARHFEVPEKLKELLAKKEKKFKKFESLIVAFNIILSKDSSFFISEGKINLRTGFLTAKSQSPDLSLTLNETLERLFSQLKKHHDKLTKKRRRLATKI